MTNNNYPPSFDWRNVDGNNYITSIKNQGLCASCVAFAAVAAIEANARIHLQLPVNVPADTVFEDLSETQLYFCNCSDCEVELDPPDALQYCKDTGLVPISACISWDDIMKKSESGTSIDVIVNFQETTCKKVTNSDQRTQIATYKTLQNQADIKQWISSKGPVFFEIQVDENFRNYKGGRVIACGGAYAHAVCCIGYDDAKSAWLCKNSMGVDWGDSGFFWLAYGTSPANDCISPAHCIEGFLKIYTTKKT